MSLLRSCRQALPRHALSRTVIPQIRGFAEDSAIATGKDDKDIVVPQTKDVTTADVVSGAPSESISFKHAEVLFHYFTAELHHRAVRIYQPTRNTMQSGAAKTERWRLDWDVLQGGGRWENPLMGWASS